VVDDRDDVFERADVICQIRGLAANADEPMDPYREGQIVVGTLGPYDLEEESYDELADRRVSAFALELMPRISRAQSMDVLSSMASIGGYKAALVAAEQLPKLFPLEMTAAGTVRPAEVFVIGAGVAGLKAIATAERMGASVKGYDIRLEVKQEVESLGADFVELDLETEGSGDDEGYAVEMGEEFYEQQRKELGRVVPESDVVITTAAIPGAPAPELVSSEMIAEMDDGSVIVDLSAPTGGNCEPTVAGETIEYEGVTVFGPTNLPATVSHTASQLFANNLYNFLEHLIEDGEVVVDTDDEIVDSTLLTHDGTIRRPHEGGGEADDAEEEDEDEDETVEDEADA
jgi:NAD(P) transhydrogenase subunit alpha